MTPEERGHWVRLMGAREEWWRSGREPALDPDSDVVDAHLHLWEARDFPDPVTGAALRTNRFIPDQYDAAGHRVTAVVYVECGNGYLTEGPDNLRPTGESAFAAEMAERFADPTRIVGIVGHADMRDPGLDAVIDAHCSAGRGLLCGLRHSAARMEDPSARLLAGAAPAGLCADPAFRRGVARLGERELTFDAFAFHPQLAEIRDLARATPGTVIVLNHLGGPVGYAGADDMVHGWEAAMDALADCPNVVVKLGGLASLVTGYDGATRRRPPTSAEFVAERGAYFHYAIRRFGAERCMFESNFPVDSTSIPYGTLWNAFKRIAAAYDAAARDLLLSGTARRVYGLKRMPSATPEYGRA